MKVRLEINGQVVLSEENARGVIVGTFGSQARATICGGFTGGDIAGLMLMILKKSPELFCAAMDGVVKGIDHMDMIQRDTISELLTRCAMDAGDTKDG